jgi:endonuclease/exonuclease/phosphatase (EEP) superfamily protein YafD
MIFSIPYILLQLILLTLMASPLLLSEVNHWWLDNLLNLQLQWSLLAAILLLAGMKYFRRISLALIPFYGLIVVGNFAHPYLPLPTPAAGAFSLSIAQLNLSYDNPHSADIFAQLAQADYDIVVLQEIADASVDNLARVSASYPYSIGSWSLGGYSSGHVLLSKWPLSDRKVHDLGYVDGRVIDVLVNLPDSDQAIRVLALHPASPRNRELWELRNSTLEFVAREVARAPHQHQLVVGDLNVSPWSTVFQNLLQVSGLQHSGDGHGYMPSWSLWPHNVITRLLGSAYIDHCLVSAGLATRDKQWQVVEGSDHLLISTRLEAN